MKQLINKSIKLNFIMNSILTMSNFIFPLITFPYVSRVLQPVGTGKVAFATSIITYFVMFAQLGIPTYGIRICAQVRDDKAALSKAVQELLIINLLTTIIAYCVFAFAIYKVPKMQMDKELFVIMSSMILLNTIGMEWLYKALEEYTYITIRSIIFKIISVIAMFICVREKTDYIIYGAISVFASSASNIINFLNAHRYISFRIQKCYDFKRHIYPILIFFAMSCATTVYTNLDTVMLGFMKSDEDVGYYNAAIKIKNILVSIITSLGTVLLPRASYYIENNLREKFESISKKAINFVYIVSLPIILYFILFAKEGIIFLSGKEYEEAVLPMQILMPTLLFIGLTNVIGIQIMVPLKKEIWVLKSVILGAIIDLIINILCIPKFASSGAAIGTLLAEFVVLVYQHYKIKDIMPELFNDINFILPIKAIMCAGVIAYFWKKIMLDAFLTLLFSAISFFGIYGIILIIMKESLVYDLIQQFLLKLKKIKIL